MTCISQCLPPSLSGYSECLALDLSFHWPTSSHAGHHPFVRVMENLRFYSTWKLNKSACHSFMGAGRIYETPGSETHASLLFTIISMTGVTPFFYVSSLSPIYSHGDMMNRVP